MPRAQVLEFWREPPRHEQEEPAPETEAGSPSSDIGMNRYIDIHIYQVDVHIKVGMFMT